MTATAAKIPPAVIATATTDSVQLANAQKFAPELAVIEANPALFAKLQADPTNKALQAQAVAAAGGGAKGLGVLTHDRRQPGRHQRRHRGRRRSWQTVAPYAADLKVIAPYSTQLTTIAPYSSELTAMAPYSAQLTALSKVPPAAIAYLTAHGAAVQNAAAQTAGQWKTWYWICFGGLIFFLLSIPLLRGRWRTRDAKRDEEEHEAMVAGGNGQAQRLSSPAERAPRALSRPLSSTHQPPDTVPAQPPLAPGTVSGLFMRQATMR